MTPKRPTPKRTSSTPPPGKTRQAASSRARKSGNPTAKTAAKAAKKATATKRSSPKDSLAEYRRKRDFTKTAEPSGAKQAAARKGKLRFVVQKHAASHLHFDLRLELDGVMKSWAVPKGPSADPSVKRLAMQVEDHPIPYNRFEGTIPKGEYGGGTVMIWDRGTYVPDASDASKNDTATVRAGIEKGDLKVTFNGERLRGSYVLVRTRGFGSSSSKPSWLLIKHRDDFANNSGKDLPDKFMTSVKSGRTMDEIAERGK